MELNSYQINKIKKVENKMVCQAQVIKIEHKLDLNLSIVLWLLLVYNLQSKEIHKFPLQGQQ
jgi:hypothetical protein